MGLNVVLLRLNELGLMEKHRGSTSSAKHRMHSQAAAEERGTTIYELQGMELLCDLPNHHGRWVVIQTALGWVSSCCALAMGLTQLVGTYREKTKLEIAAESTELRWELELLQGYLKRQSIARGAATRVAKAEAARLYALTPEGLAGAAVKLEVKAFKAAKRQAQIEARKVLKRLAARALVHPDQLTAHDSKVASRDRCAAAAVIKVNQLARITKAELAVAGIIRQRAEAIANGLQAAR